jgi:hypothetical protein
MIKFVLLPPAAGRARDPGGAPRPRAVRAEFATPQRDRTPATRFFHCRAWLGPYTPQRCCGSVTSSIQCTIRSILNEDCFS